MSAARIIAAVVAVSTILAAAVTFCIGEASVLGAQGHHVAAWTLGVSAVTFAIALISAVFAWLTS